MDGTMATHVVGIDLGQHLGVALCRDGRITQAGLLEGPTATQRLCAALRKFREPPAICWEKSLWLPGRKSAFAGVEQQRGAILGAVPGAEALEVMPQEVRGALLGDRNATDGAILEWVIGYHLSHGGPDLWPMIPKKQRWEKIMAEKNTGPSAEMAAMLEAAHHGKAAHVCDAIALALYGWDRLYSPQALALREAMA